MDTHQIPISIDKIITEEEVDPDTGEMMTVESVQSELSEKFETRQSLNKDALFPILISAIQEQQEQIEVLREEIRTLKKGDE